MASYFAYIVKFLLRIKWWLILCPALVAICVYILMGRMPRTYRSSMTIYTGVVSGYTPGEDTKQDWNAINNAMDNLINILTSQSTLHEVSLRLYARNMAFGNMGHNHFLTPQHYQQELAHTPSYVRNLVVRHNEEQTLENLKHNELPEHNNHIYGLFYWTHRYYSYAALSKIKVVRINNSDMLEVSYENDDPDVVYNTLDILSKEFINQYRALRFGETSNVIQLFESELARVNTDLRNKEDSLRDYNIEQQVINYDEQTKHIAILSRDFELKEREIELDRNSAAEVQKALENRIEGLESFRKNASFIEQLQRIGDLESRISLAESYSAINDSINASPTTIVDTKGLRTELTHQTDSLKRLTQSLANQRLTKEGFPASMLIQQWLDAVLLSAKSDAQQKVMSEWKKSLDQRYEQYAPVGATIKRKTRLIDFAEQTYMSILEAINTARLRQKDLLTTSAALKVINPPMRPISAEPTKRKTTVAASFFASFLFILFIFILRELLDRTLRDEVRTQRITGHKVIGAFPAPLKGRRRRYTDQYRAAAARALCNTTFNYLSSGTRPYVVNIISTNSGDGKSTVMESMAEHLRGIGMQVRTVIGNVDFAVGSREYLMATGPKDLTPGKEGEVSFDDADIVLIEYPPIMESAVPTILLRNASLNIMVIPANCTWSAPDQQFVDREAQMVGNPPLVVCLNYASREVLQSFTGMLPPYSILRKFGHQMGQFGFTSSR